MTKRSPRTRPERDEAMAIATALRTSPRKLNLVAATIRNKPVARALAELSFNRRRIALEVRKVLESAIANAENNHNLDVDRLVVVQAYVGRAIVMRRFLPASKGRSHPIAKPYSRLTIVVREVREPRVARGGRLPKQATPQTEERV